MNWLKRLWQKYTAKARANDFPIKDCGLFGGKMKSPCNVDEAAKALHYIISLEDKDRFQEWSEDKFVAATHHNLGRWIRNVWGLWDETSKLHIWFKSIGIWHADDMSGIILTTYYRKVHSLPVRLEEQVQHYKEYWKALDKEQVRLVMD